MRGGGGWDWGREIRIDTADASLDHWNVTD